MANRTIEARLVISGEDKGASASIASVVKSVRQLEEVSKVSAPMQRLPKPVTSVMKLIFKSLIAPYVADDDANELEMIFLVTPEGFYQQVFRQRLENIYLEERSNQRRGKGATAMKELLEVRIHRFLGRVRKTQLF